MQSDNRAWCTIGVLVMLLATVPVPATAQQVSGARRGVVQHRPAASDTTSPAVRTGLPAGVKGGLIGTLVGAATGAALSYAAHQAYCGETSSCGDYPDRSFRDATLVGAGIGLLLGIGIEGLMTDRRERDRRRDRPDEG